MNQELVQGDGRALLLQLLHELGDVQGVQHLLSQTIRNNFEKSEIIRGVLLTPPSPARRPGNGPVRRRADQ